MTSKELAGILGVSQSTVSRSLNDSPLISAETKKLVFDAAKKYNFVFNENARRLKCQSVNMIGVLMPNDFIDFYKSMTYGELFNKIKFEFAKYNIETIAFCLKNEDLYQGINRLVVSRKIDGLIILRQKFYDDLKEILENQKIPYIFLNRADIDNQKDNYISIDYYKGGWLAGEYFAKKNHTKILCLSSYLYPEIMGRRVKGFVEGLQENGVTYNTENVSYGDGSFESGYEFVIKNQNLIHANTALFAVTDQMALGVIQACNALFIPVPGKLSVIGFEGIEIASWIKPRLTTVKINTTEIAKHVSAFFLNGTDQDRESHNVVLECSFEENESCQEADNDRT